MHPIRRYLFILLALVLLALDGQAATCPAPEAQVRVTVEDRTIHTAVVSTPESRQCGLSHRSELRAGEGMLFVFPQTQTLSFWMKDTFVPLSIAFLDGSGEILAIKDMDPDRPLQRHRSPAPARYALEVAQGWFERHGIGAGDRCHFQLPTDLPVR